MITPLHIEEFIKQAHRVGDAGLTVCSSGNLSWRIGDEALVSGTGSWVPTIQKEKVSQCVVATGEVLNGVKPSMESGFHLGVLRQRPDVNVVLHFQSPYATAVSCMKKKPENYNVTAAEKMIPACDLSEQISLASKEASGTGNMKFMLNGALTLGTMDGANVEIAEAVGSQNIYIFGQSSKQVIDRYNRGDYCSAEWYEADPNLKRAVDFLISEEMLSRGNENYLARLHNELIYKDWFQTMPDFNAYIIRKNQALCDYKYNRTNWASKTLINISKAGFFSSDRKNARKRNFRG